MKKLILILFLIVSVVAQDDNTGQSIELPDFVITGKQNISLPAMKKAKPDLVPVLSKEFFYPTFSPEDFTLSTVSMPSKSLANLLPEKDAYNAQLILGAGQYTLPTGEFHFGQSFESGQFYTKLWGSNTTDYVDYANYNVSGINLNTQFFIDREASALPGLGIGVDGYFIRDKYHFYGSDNPSSKRETQKGGVKLSFVNQFNEIFKYGINLYGNYLDIKESAFKELIYSADISLRFISPKFNFDFEGLLTQQKLDYTFSDQETLGYYNAGGAVIYKVSPDVYLKGGAKFYLADNYNWGEIDNEKFFAPIGEIGMKLNNRLSIVMAYNPHAEFITTSDLIGENRYITVSESKNVPPWDNTNHNVFEKYNSNIRIDLKYAYDKYYELNFRVEYAVVDNYHFFSNEGLIPASFVETFDTAILDDVKLFMASADALYHLGPFGWLYGSAEYLSATVDPVDQIPYHPHFNIDASYGYKFNFGFTMEFGIIYRSEMYADILNSVLVDDYINLTTELRYSLIKNLDLTFTLNNLLNRDNYLWIGYIEKPFDFVAGIDYRF